MRRHLENVNLEREWELVVSWEGRVSPGRAGNLFGAGVYNPGGPD